MLLPELHATHLALNPAAGSSALRAWTSGQILQATVVRQSSEGTVTLRIGNQEMQAHTGLRLAADQPLTLQIAQSGTQTVLRVLHASHLAATPNLLASRPTVPASPEQVALTQAWRQVLPRSGDFAPLLGQLKQLAIPAAATSAAALPAPVAAALRQFAARLPTMEALTTAAGLRRAVDNSGLFLEARLASALINGSKPSLQNDLKANLLQLVATLRTAVAMNSNSPGAPQTAAGQTAPGPDPAAAQILRPADAALARVEQQQLATVSHAATPVIQIPITSGAEPQLLELCIEHDQCTAATTEQTAPWNVWLHFDLNELGSVHARITLAAESVTVGLWAEQAHTAALFEQHLGELDDALRLAGLAPAGLQCHRGRPPRPEDHRAPDNLLDERA